MDDKDDVRIKMCIKPIEEDLFTVYHELGHVYYYLWYKDQPILFQDGAHDGFHEAIGDTVNLSVTPAYLRKIGLVGAVNPSKEAIINQQMKMALDKIAFLPFGKLIDEWRWGVFDGRIKPADYNKAWWELREKYQGVSRAGGAQRRGFRSGREVPHPGNTPYTRYFLSFILQFQFHKALCDAAGYKGPLQRVLDLRQHRSRQEVRRDARAGREPALAGHAGEAHRHAPDGRVGDHRLLRAAGSVARRTEQGPDLRLGLRE